MFKFGFSKDDNDDSKQDTLTEKKLISWKESKEIKCEELKSLENFLEDCEINCIEQENLKIKYISSTDIIVKLIKELDDEETDTILKAEENHSDLLTGIYEGGLKIWECTYDLVDFLERKNLDFDGKKVLDLGCGTGVIGILSSLKKATCYFQDYNEEVIKHVTIPNFMINFEDTSQGKLNSYRFFSGDWSSFSNLLQKECIEDNDKFDYIFTCETIYNPENYQKLHDVFKALLKTTGIVYLAAKSYYFGVGGGLSEFKDFIQSQNVFIFKSVWKHSNGLEREILELKLKNH